NCAAIPHDLLESELFGHERGAFTGAVATKKGKFELAHHGSLFLDEIGEMPLDLQVKLLHVLENQKFTRLGGTQFLQTNTRIIAATNRNLREEVTQKRFRQDLFYRLKVVYLHIPPLRERPEDIPALAQYFLNKHQNSAPQKITRFSEEALQLLLQYPWPGNVREMENVILQAMIFAQNGIITPAVLPEEILTYQGSASTPLTKTDLQIEKNRRTEKIITDLERQFLTRVLQKTHGNISEAARLSGYDRRQIQNLIKKHRINSEDFK
ncbi:MAG TPA: sigma-54-dependent Fis family transcriptional regulator, partial [Caldithrix sp.]|nr:sigma-54-dependent Fis family transcriptional regulator [Caldithrix sp.]